MKYYFLLCFLVGVRVLTVAQQPANKTTPAHHTYKTFAAQKTRFGYHQIGKATYLIERVPDSLISRGEEEEMKLIRANAATATVYYPGAVSCSGDVFAGEKRAEAKTHEATTVLPRNLHQLRRFLPVGLTGSG